MPHFGEATQRLWGIPNIAYVPNDFFFLLRESPTYMHCHIASLDPFSSLRIANIFQHRVAGDVHKLGAIHKNAAPLESYTGVPDWPTKTSIQSFVSGINRQDIAEIMLAPMKTLVSCLATEIAWMFKSSALMTIHNAPCV